jgi:hypothetical protein
LQTSPSDPLSSSSSCGALLCSSAAVPPPTVSGRPSPPPAPGRSTSHLDAGHRPSSSSLALSRACHAAPWLCRPPPHRSRGKRPCTPPRPLFSSSRASLAPYLSIPLSLLLSTRPKPLNTTTAPSSSPASPWSPRSSQPNPHCPGRPPVKLHRSMPKLYDPTLTPILHRSPVAVVPLLSGELLSPSNPSLHPFSVLTSCCS